MVGVQAQSHSAEEIFEDSGAQPLTLKPYQLEKSTFSTLSPAGPGIMYPATHG